MKTIFLSIFCLLAVSILPSQAQVSDTTLFAQENIYFDFGSDQLRSSEMPKLNAFIQKIPRDLQGFIRLTAHTDSVGTSQNNYALSERRGTQVINYLVQNRIAPLSFYTSYDGENRPIAENMTDKGRQMNRRVELEVFQIQVSTPPPAAPSKTTLKPKKKITTIATQKSKIKIIVLDEETRKGIQADISYQLPKSKKPKKTKTRPDGKGLLIFPIQETTKVSFDVFAKGYFHNSVQRRILPNKNIAIEVLLKPIKKGNILTLKKLYFYGNQDKLLPSSIPELARLAKSLATNPKVKVEIGGHINYPNVHPRDVPQWSVRLSERRAEAVYKYLTEHGIDSKRLTTKGYSNTQMKFPRARIEKEMAQNRRVEIKVIDN